MVGDVVRNLVGKVRELVAKSYSRVSNRFHRDLAGTDDENHPERLAVLPFVGGRCLEVGCGFRKTHPTVIGIDLVPKGRRGRIGNVKGKISQADVVGDGAHLPFASDSFDAIIARHNLEHYVDTAGTLLEWRRLLRNHGMLAVVLPDEGRYPGRTVELDPTHYHGYTEEALARLVELIGGFREITTRPVIDGWSFMLTAIHDATVTDAPVT